MMVVLTTSSYVAPAAASTSPMFFITCSVCSSIESPANSIAGVSPICPLTYTVFPTLTAWLYGPAAAADVSVDAVVDAVADAVDAVADEEA